MEQLKRTNEDRVVFPDDGITKGEVIDHYERVAGRMLPYLEGRPLILERFRKSIADGGFYQQGRPDHFPDYVPRIDVERADGKAGHHTGCDSAEALLYLANQGVLTFHRWASREPDLEHPDVLVVDLDPVDEDFAPVRRAALEMREILAAHSLEGQPVLTGSSGLHILVAPPEKVDWEGLRELGRTIGAEVVARDKTAFTRAFYKSQRRGRLYIDTGRTRRGHAAVVPWSVRAKPGAPIAAPIDWERLEDPATHARSVTLRSLAA